MAEEKILTQEASVVEEETSQPVEEKKEKGWVKLVLFSGLGLFLVGALVFAGYTLGQKGIRLEIVRESTPTPTPESIATPEVLLTPSPFPTETPVGKAEPTVDWEIYTNSKYDYQFKHPLRWIFKATVVGDETKPLYVIRESVASNNIDDYVVSIKVWNNPDKHSLVDWLQFMKDSNALPLPAEDVELVANYTVGGEPAFRIWSDPISKGKEPGKCFQACPVLSVYFTHGDKAFVAEDVYMREVDETSQKIFELLLSTFQFLE